MEAEGDVTRGCEAVVAAADADEGGGAGQGGEEAEQGGGEVRAAVQPDETDAPPGHLAVLAVNAVRPAAVAAVHVSPREGPRPAVYGVTAARHTVGGPA